MQILIKKPEERTEAEKLILKEDDIKSDFYNIKLLTEELKGEDQISKIINYMYLKWIKC